MPVTYRITIDVTTRQPNWVATQKCAEGYAQVLCDKTLGGRAAVVDAHVVDTGQATESI